MGNKSSRKDDSSEEEERESSSSPQVRKKGPLLIKDEEGKVRIKIKDQSETSVADLGVDTGHLDHGGQSASQMARAVP